MPSLTKNVLKPRKPRKFHRGQREKTGISIRRFLLMKSVTKDVLNACIGFSSLRDNFIELFQNEIQFSNEFNQDMYLKIMDILRRIAFTCGDPSLVVDSDVYKSSSSSGSIDSGKSSLSSIEEIPDPQGVENITGSINLNLESIEQVPLPINEMIIQPNEENPLNIVTNEQLDEKGASIDNEESNGYQESESFRVNFAFHAERVLKCKFMLLEEKQSYSFAAELAIAAKMTAENIKKLKLDKMVAYLQHAPV